MTNRPLDPAIARALLQIVRITAAAWDVPMPARHVQAGTASALAQGWFARRASPHAGGGQAASSASG